MIDFNDYLIEADTPPSPIGAGGPPATSAAPPMPPMSIPPLSGGAMPSLNAPPSLGNMPSGGGGPMPASTKLVNIKTSDVWDVLEKILAKQLH